VGTVRYYARIYVMIVAQYVKARMQYRLDFFVSTVAMLMANAAGILFFWVLFKTIPRLSGWSYPELLFVYAYSLLSLTPLQMFFDNVWQLKFHVQDGSFIRYYLKPLNMMFYYMSEVFDLKGLSHLFLGAGAMVYASAQLHLSWSPGKVVLLCLSVFSSALVMISILIMSASVSFWVLNSHYLTIFAYKLRDFAHYPLDVFNRPLQVLFSSVVPMGFIAYYPSQLFLRARGSLVPIVASPAVGVLLFVIACGVWSLGTRKYAGTGS